LVLTIAIGEDYQKMKVLTYLSFRTYVDKIDADLIRDRVLV